MPKTVMQSKSVLKFVAVVLRQTGVGRFPLVQGKSGTEKKEREREKRKKKGERKEIALDGVLLREQ